MLIGGKPCYFLNDFSRYRCCRCRIQNNRNVVLAAQIHDVMHCIQRNLMLQDDHVIAQKIFFDTVYIGTVYLTVCARNYNNGIVVITDRDDGNACGHTLHCTYLIRFDAVGDQIFHHFASVVVVTYASEHCYVRTKPCHCDCLVGSFAAGNVAEAMPRKCFSLVRNPVGDDCLVDINASYNCQFQFFFPLSIHFSFGNFCI